MTVGGIIVLALFINGWSVDRCMQSFVRLALLTFKSRLISARRAYAFFVNSLYPAHNLEGILQDNFGRDRSILDYSMATAKGVRIGLPVTTVQDASPCIFTNYNGVGTRSLYSSRLTDLQRDKVLTSSGYHVLRPKDGLGRIPLWKI